jgi:hypothetical protein
MATFYKAVVQSGFLYGSESWVLSEKMMSSLRSFTDIATCSFRGDTSNGSKETFELAGRWTIEECIERQTSTVMEYEKERPIYRRCLASKAIASRPTCLSVLALTPTGGCPWWYREDVALTWTASDDL